MENNTIGIIVAMASELRLLLPLMTNHSQTDYQGYTFHEGNIGNAHVVAMECGIGKVNAAIGANALIDYAHPSIIINSGVAGGTGAGASMLDVVVADSIAYHDVWCGPGTVPGQASRCPLYFVSSPDLISLPSLQETDTLRHGLICSGDIFVSQPEEVERIRSLYPDVMAVDMESAAIAQVCFMREVPFLCIRVISDTPGQHDDNVAQYNDFWTKAPQHTFAVIKSVVNELAR